MQQERGNVNTHWTNQFQNYVLRTCLCSRSCLTLGPLMHGIRAPPTPLLEHVHLLRQLLPDSWRTYCPPVLLVDAPPFTVFNQILLLNSIKVDSESMMISFRLKLIERSSAAALNYLWRAPLGDAVETISPPSPRALVFGTFLKAQLWISCNCLHRLQSVQHMELRATRMLTHPIRTL